MSLIINTGKLIFGNVIYRVISLVTAPIISRLFLPADFGVRQILTSIVTLFTVISCLKYELSIPLGKNKREVNTSLVLSMFIAITFGLLVLIVSFLIGPKIIVLFNIREIKNYLLLLPLAVVVGGLSLALRPGLAYNSRFNLLALTGIVNGSVMAGFAILWGLTFGSSAAGLFIAFLLGECAVFLLMIIPSFPLLKTIFKDLFNPQALLKGAKKNKKFPIFSTWAELFSTFSFQLPVFALAFLFSKVEVGYFSLAYNTVNLPVQLLSRSVLDVFFPSAARRYTNTQDLSSIVKKVFEKLVQIGLFPLLVIFLFGPRLFAFVFGKNWIEAGIYAQILSIWLFFILITFSLGGVVPNILRRQGSILGFNIIIIFSMLIGLFLGAKIGGPRSSLSMFVLLSTCILYIYFCWIFRLSAVSIYWGHKLILKYIALSFLTLAPVLFLSSFFLVNIFFILVGLSLSSIFYCLILIRMKPGLLEIFSGFTKEFVFIEKVKNRLR